MSKDPGYSDSRKDTLESRNRFLQDKISELTSEVAALDEAKQFFQERNETLINKIEYLNQVNDGLHLLLKEAEDKEKKLVEALKFYDSYNSPYTETFELVRNTDDAEYAGIFKLNDSEILQDGSDSCNLFSGKLARQVLKEIGEE